MPQVTVILPAKDAERYIATTLETLLRQFDDPAALKLVAIDDGSPLVAVILRTRLLRRRGAALLWTDESSHITVTPALYQDPIRRPAPV